MFLCAFMTSFIAISKVFFFVFANKTKNTPPFKGVYTYMLDTVFIIGVMDVRAQFSLIYDIIDLLCPN